MINGYRNSLKKVSDNLLAELVKKDANWHTIELIGRELIVLTRNGRVAEIKERQKHILSKYGRE